MTRPTYSVERLGALSDGVFAIVLTLLVLELKIPELPELHTEGQMLADLAEKIPSLIAWLISFFLIARFWTVHHDILASLTRCHTATVAWNFVTLALVSLVPFASGLIGTYEYDPLAVVIFSVTFAITGLSVGCFARHAQAERALHSHGHVNLGRHWRYHARLVPLVAATSCACLAINEVLALGVWLGEPLLALGVSFAGRDAAPAG